MTNYSLIRSNRKTLALYIINGILEVRAPLKFPKQEIDKFVLSKEKWIKSKLTKSIENKNKSESFKLQYGDLITYRGKSYPIVAKRGNRAGFENGEFFIPPDLPSDDIKSACEVVYILLAKHDITQKVLHYSKQMNVAEMSLSPNVKPIAVKINSAKTRWGSCSTRKTLNFSWRLIVADDDLIDYVVVHELAHMIQMNHSKLFWDIVEKVLPDFKCREKRLKELQRKLTQEGW